MSLSRRETIAGAISWCTVGLPSISGMPKTAGANRRPLEPLGPISVRFENSRRRASLGAYFAAYDRPEAREVSVRDSAEALLSIYGDLIEGRAIRATDIERLSAGHRQRLRDLPDDVPWDVAPFAHDYAVCRLIDDAVAEIVDQDWDVAPTASARRMRVAKAILDAADRLRHEGCFEAAVTRCDEVISRFGESGPQAARAMVNRCCWLRESGRAALDAKALMLA